MTLHHVSGVSAFLCSLVTGIASVSVVINDTALVHTTEAFFTSYALDISNFFESTPVNMSSPQFQYMAPQLAPAVLRIGGGQADYTYYFSSEDGGCGDMPSNFHCFTRVDLEMLMDFVSATDAKLIFGLSMGYPTYPNKSTKAWNSSNAQQFLEFIVDNGYGERFYGFELGNEVNKHGWMKPAFQVDAFKQLRTIVSGLYGKYNLSMPILAGPDPLSSTLR